MNSQQFTWKCPSCSTINQDSRQSFVLCEKCGTTQDVPLSDSEIEQLSQQEPLPEGWTEYSEHTTAFQRVKRMMEEQD